MTSPSKNRQAMFDDATKFFFELTPERILTAAERFGGRCTGRIDQLNSMENRVYEVELESEDDMPTAKKNARVIKFYRPGRWTKAQIMEEHQYLRELREKEVPVAAPLVNSDGETLLEDKDVGILFAIWPKFTGRCPDELREEHLEQLGRLIARVHQVGATHGAPNRLQLSAEVFGTANLRFLMDSGQVPEGIRAQYSWIVEQICAHAEPMFANANSHRIHGDCHLGNLLLSNGQFSVVDFDDMISGPAVQDLWLFLPGRGDQPRQMLNLLLEGYEQIRYFNRDEIDLIEVLRALRFVHYSAWIARRWHDPYFQRAFPQFGTPVYWKEQLSDLQEQLIVIQEGGFKTASSFDSH
jgi:Ser/Thr protein kinase RdoA (MazF antagonist)